MANTNANTPNAAATFSHWTNPDGLTITPNLTSRTICVVGFQTGNKDLFGVYNVNQAPVANAGVDKSTTEGSSVSFTFSCTDANTADTWTAIVDWGDSGAVQSLGAVTCNSGTFSASHTYVDDNPTATASDIKTVTLTVTDNRGLSGSDTASVTVSNANPVADAGTDQTGAEGSPVTFTFDCTDVGGNDTWTASVTWGDTTSSSLGAVTCNAAGTFSASHTYADNGTYTVTLTVTDDDTGAGSDTATATIANVAPSIAISGAASVNEGSTYSLTLGAITDPGDDTVTSYVVHWGDGSSDTYSSGGIKTHIYADGPNSYNITVDLVDEDGTFLNRANALSVSVLNVAPALTASVSPTNTFINFIVTASGLYTDAGIPDTHTVTIDWDDGTADTTFVDNSGNGGGSFGPATHIYGVAGTYTVTITICDDDDGCDTETFTVNVQAGLFGLQSGTTITNSAFAIGDSLTVLSEFEVLKQKDNTVVATNPGQFYMHGRAQNVTGGPVAIEITLDWDQSGFMTQGATPVHCYIRPPAGGWSATPCTIVIDAVNGKATATFGSVPNSYTVWVTVHLDYKLKGTKSTDMTPKSYAFTSTWTVGPLAGSDTATLMGYPKKTTLIYGYVLDAAGQPIAGADVKITVGGVMYTYTTGSDGFYVFYDGQTCTGDGVSCSTGPTGAALTLPNANYVLRITAPAGYCVPTATATVNVNTQSKAFRKDWTLYATCP